MARSTRLEQAQGRKFAFTLGIALAVIGLFFFWRDRMIGGAIFSAPAGMLVLAGALVPGQLGGLERRWMAFGHFMSQITSPILLGFAYFAVFTPLGWVVRRFKVELLSTPDQSGTAWVARDEEKQTDLRRQF